MREHKFLSLIYIIEVFLNQQMYFMMDFEEDI
jgi:hypothetical protein